MGPEVAAALCQGIVLLLVMDFGFGRLCLRQDTFGIPTLQQTYFTDSSDVCARTQGGTARGTAVLL